MAARKGHYVLTVFDPLELLVYSVITTWLIVREVG